jgi:hypothetical protein
LRSHSQSLIAPTFAFVLWIVGFIWVFVHLG